MLKPKKTVLVIGDSMADITEVVSTKKLAQGGPAVTATFTGEVTTMPGAAGLIADILRNLDIRVRSLLTPDGTWRRRYYSPDGDLLFRIDHDEAPKRPLSWDLDVFLTGGIPDCIVICDYAQGGVTEDLFTDLSSHPATREVPFVVCVKPKLLTSKPFLEWLNTRPEERRNVLLVMNLEEAEQAAPHFCPTANYTTTYDKIYDHLNRISLAMTHPLRCDVMVTAGASGAFYTPADGSGCDVSFCPAPKGPAGCVVGAGDVAAAAAASLIAERGHTLGGDKELREGFLNYVQSAAELARRRTHPGEKISITSGTLATRHRYNFSRQKVQVREELIKHLTSRRGTHAVLGIDPLTVGVANGCFDVLHADHLELLREAAKGCDVLVVLVNDDDSVRSVKGEDRPVLPLEIRMESLAACPYVDYVTPFSGLTPIPAIEEIEPDFLFKGKDCTDARPPGSNFVESRGGKVVFTGADKTVSTTQIVEGQDGGRQEDTEGGT